jgi:predicted permease
VLLTGAGLLLRSLSNISAVDPGFDPAHALAFDLSLPAATYSTPEERLAFSAELLRRIRALPGVEAAGTAMAVPVTGGGFGEYLSRPDRPAENDHVLGRVDYVSEGYLEALGTRLVAGRRLNTYDNRPDGPRIAVINATLARVFYPGENAIGRQIAISGKTWEVVGIIADVVDRRLDLPFRPFAYLPQAFNPYGFSVVLRTSLAPLGLVASVREALAQAGPGVALANIRTLDGTLVQSMAQQRMTLSLIGAFAAAALLLASIGLYGVMAYSVATRRRELCIRMALGAVRGTVIWDILRDGMRLTGVGLCLGLAGALVAGSLLATQLYQVRSADPLVALQTALVMGLVAFIACMMPAWNAARSNPIAALRNE